MSLLRKVNEAFGKYGHFAALSFAMYPFLAQADGLKDRWIYADSIKEDRTYIGEGSGYKNPKQALGPPSKPQSFENAVTLGKDGYITVIFNQCTETDQGTGHDLEIGEIVTPEPIIVEVSTKLNPNDFISIGKFTRQSGQPFRIDLDLYGIEKIHAITIRYAGEGTYAPYFGPDIDYVATRGCMVISQNYKQPQSFNKL